MEYNKSKVLDWLSSLIDYKFKHHFSDRWISVNVWDNTLSISFDHRQSNQVELFNKLPKEIKGCLQKGTGILVNENTLYFTLSELVNIIYPKIVSYKQIKNTRHNESVKGGGYVKGSYWYTYDWELTLSDGSTIEYHNQVNKMNLTESDYIFKCRIEEREFNKFIENFNKNK